MSLKLIRKLNAGDSFVVKNPLEFTDEDISNEVMKQVEGHILKIKEVVQFSYMVNRYYVEDPFAEPDSITGERKSFDYLLIESDIDVQKTNLLLMKQSANAALEKINPKNKLPFL